MKTHQFYMILLVLGAIWGALFHISNQIALLVRP